MVLEEAGKKLVGALILISAGIEDPETLDVTADVGQKLIECYDGLAGE